MPVRHALVLVVVLFGTATAFAQPQNARERARPAYTSGLEYMRVERFAAAASSFESATTIDPSFELAHYMLGRAYLALKDYHAAVDALMTARDLYVADATRRFQDRAEGQRHRRTRVAEIDDLLSQLRNLPRQTPEIQGQIRQLEEHKRQLEDRDRQVDPEGGVPAFVLLSLGSAHFRAGNFGLAEQAWRDAIAADPGSGEAHNNLAVVLLETGRYDEAERSVRNAEKAGRPVPQALKDEIRKRRRSSTR